VRLRFDVWICVTNLLVIFCLIGLYDVEASLAWA
jgi:hypothetical protein